MKAIVVDDEIAMLSALKEAVEASTDIEKVDAFSACSAVLEYIEENEVDIAFLDIMMRGIGGIELAKKIQEVHPECKIVFCTGYSEYAIEAFQQHVSGYLMKPITKEAVQKEIDHIKELQVSKKVLKVNCFGNFEVLANGKPLSFKRSKTKELFAYLIDRNGSGVTSQQICAVLWEDGDEKAKLVYLRQLFSDLRHTINEANISGIVRVNGYQYSVETEKIDCDYYSYLKTGFPKFHGEYMSQYSWAEGTCSVLAYENKRD